MPGVRPFVNYRMLLHDSKSEPAGEARKVESSKSQVKKQPGVPGGEASSRGEKSSHGPTLELDLE